MDLLTVQETAQMLRVHPMTVRRYISSGRLTAVRIGRRIRVPLEAVGRLAKPVDPREHAGPVKPFVFKRPSAAELARRRELADRTLKNREKRDIRPLTTADLVRMGRDDDFWYGRD